MRGSGGQREEDQLGGLAMLLGKRPLTWLVLGLGLVACVPRHGGEQAEVALNQNVVLISVDTLRADRLGCYGHSKKTSPNIDRFARDAFIFRDVISHAPSTLPAHASIFTSMLPSLHGASHRFSRALPEQAVTLAEVLHEAGFSTASFNGGGQVAAEFGLAQGFSVYESEPRVSDQFETTAGKALDWIDGNARQPFFLFLHTFEVHQPFGAAPRHVSAIWDGPDRGDPAELLRAVRSGAKPLDRQSVDYLSAHYDAEVRSMDEGVSSFLDGLRSRDLYRNTMIVLTSDHGEELGERGAMIAHAHTLHQELLNVPMIIKLAGAISGSGQEVDGMVRGIDIGPTILSALGLDIPPTFMGENIMGRKTSRRRVAISYQDTVTEHPVFGVTTDRWKVIGPRLYDRLQDPLERTDVVSEHRSVHANLAALRVSMTDAQTLPEALATPSDETLEQLRALGYLD